MSMAYPLGDSIIQVFDEYSFCETVVSSAQLNQPSFHEVINESYAECMCSNSAKAWKKRGISTVLVD